jgi:hypothetical protein
MQLDLEWYTANKKGAPTDEAEPPVNAVSAVNGASAGLLSALVENQTTQGPSSSFEMADALAIESDNTSPEDVALVQVEETATTVFGESIDEVSGTHFPFLVSLNSRPLATSSWPYSC